MTDRHQNQNPPLDCHKYTMIMIPYYLSNDCDPQDWTFTQPQDLDDDEKSWLGKQNKDEFQPDQNEEDFGRENL